jgi:hypothetical protein
MIEFAAVGGTELSDTDPAVPSRPEESEPTEESDSIDRSEDGFSPAEKLIGLGAAYKAPLASSAAATFMLRYETNPERREQLERYRRGALIWFSVGIAAAIVAVIIIVSVVASHNATCRGGIDRFTPPTYTSSGSHWTATYQCNNGGSKTVRVPAKQVPGGG